MQLRTPKRYTAKGSRRPLLNLHWLWLYILVPILLIPAVLVWDNRQSIGDNVSQWLNKHVLVAPLPTPTPAPTLTGDASAALAEAFKGGHVNKAVNILETLSDQNPNAAGFPALAAQFEALRSYGSDKAKLDEASQMATRAINADPEAYDGWLSKAIALDYSGQPQRSLPYALHARDFDDKNPMIIAVMGEIYHDLNQDDQAKKLLTDAIAKAQAATPVYRAALAHAYYVQAEILDASNAAGADVIKMLEKAWATAISDPPDPSIPSGYIAQYLSAYYLNIGQPNQAIQLLTAAVARDADDPILQLALGNAYLNQGDANKARTYISTCHDLAPQEPKCLRALAQLYFGEQNYQQAADSIQQVIGQGSQKSSDYYLAGLSYGYLNECAKAVTVLQQGLPFVDPSDSKSLSKFSDALQGCGAAAINLTTLAATDSAPVATLTPTPKKR
ncbi:MAG TPA: tetratricopeptide repeat protein [Aggregatilineales bacterium]|nr:tetratricopeptide repeat protein [Aggregatilineales bacterium]